MDENQMEEEAVSPADAEVVETMVAGLKEHIYGPAEADMVKMLKQSQDVGQDIGAATLALVQSAADQATQSGIEFDLDMMMGVASEIIDSLLSMAEAVGVIESADDDGLRGDAMMAAVHGYIATLQPGSDEQEAAKQMLQQMQDSGMVAEAEQTVAEMGKRKGIDPFAEGAPAGVDQGGQPPQPAPQPGGQRRLMAG
jgi:hypothetical protein